MSFDYYDFVSFSTFLKSRLQRVSLEAVFHQMPANYEWHVWPSLLLFAIFYCRCTIFWFALLETWYFCFLFVSNKKRALQNIFYAYLVKLMKPISQIIENWKGQWHIKYQIADSSSAELKPPLLLTTWCELLLTLRQGSCLLLKGNINWNVKIMCHAFTL